MFQHPKTLCSLLALTLTLACGAQDLEDRLDGADLARDSQELQTAPASDTLRANLRKTLRVPAATGPYAVGVRTTFVRDPSRIDPETQLPRALPTWVYYPAFATPKARPAPYFSETLRALFESDLGWPAGTLDVDTGVLLDARPRPDFRGVLLVSGGWATPVVFETALMAELASQGWVLVAFDHPHDTARVEQPNGHVISGQLDSTQGFLERVPDVGVVLAHLSELVPGVRSSTPIAMWGHSLGGATAVEALRVYPRLWAAVDVDGTPRGDVVTEGTSEPVGIMSSNAFIDMGQVDTELAKLVSNLRGPRPVLNMFDIHHYGFSDFVLFNQQAKARDPELGAQMEAAIRTDSDSLDEGRAAIATQRRFLVRFMDRYVDGR